MQRKVLVILLLAGTLAAVGVWLWPRQKPHVLLITLDTTRADRLGCYGYERAQTPVLDALAQAGILCEHAYTVAPLTLPAHASLLTGLYPAENGVRTNGRGRLDEAIPTLAEVLRRQGYDTGAFVASFVLDGKFGLDRGFKTYDDDFAGDEPASDALHRQRHGEAVVDAALAWLNEKRSRPFFCWVHLYDPHFPYLAHEDLFGDTFADRPYDAEIAYVDRQVGRLVSFLKSQGLDSRTVVMVVGDHGEGLGEHVERQHGSTLYNTTLHVPLIVCHPGKLAPGGRLTENVSLVDISPTVLDLAGVTDPRKVTGKSFKAGLQGKLAALAPCYGATDEPFLNNGWSPLRSLTDGNWKYIKTTRVELYHLADDPGELNNRAEKEPERTRAMAAQLEAFESRLTLRQEATVQLSPQERRALASLGYAGGTHPEPAGGDQAHLPDVKDMLPLDNAVEEAADLVAQGSYDAAIPRLREVIEKSPSHSRAYWVLACALRDQKEFDEAATVLLKLLDVKPDSREGHYGLGLILLERGRITEGTEELSKALQLDPEFAEAHHDLAMTYMRSGNEEKALAHFGRVLEIDHCHGTAYQWRAFLLARQGNVSAAIADYRKALTYIPDSPHTHHNFGVVLAQTGNHEEAERHLRQAVELSPENAEMQYALGAFLLTRGEAEEAVQCLEKALNLKPDYAAAREELSKARRALKDGQAPGN